MFLILGPPERLDVICNNVVTCACGGEKCMLLQAEDNGRETASTLAIGHPVSAPTRRRAVLADVKTDLAGSPMPRASV